MIIKILCDNSEIKDIKKITEGQKIFIQEIDNSYQPDFDEITFGREEKKEFDQYYLFMRYEERESKEILNIYLIPDNFRDKIVKIIYNLKEKTASNTGRVHPLNLFQENHPDRILYESIIKKQKKNYGLEELR